MTRLYRYDISKNINICDIKVNKIILSNPFKLFAKCEIFSFKEYLIRLRWCLKTFGKAIVYYYYDEHQSDVQHTSFLIPYCNKFPFMKKKDFQIGPCYTKRTARGKGLYPKVLNFIVLENSHNNSDFYMIVNDNNPASVKGIKKAGFIETGFEIIHNKNGVYETKNIIDVGNDEI